MLKISQKYTKPLDYLFIFRPTLFFPIWIFALAGYATQSMANGKIILWNLHVNWLIVMNFVLLTLAAGATFILNQIRDIDTDKDNQKLFLISEDHIKPHKAKKIAFISMGIAGIAFLIQKPVLFLLLFLLLLFWGYLYNFKPFVWKDRPWAGLFINILSGLFLFLIGWVFAGDLKLGALLHSIPYVMAWGSVALLTTIPDMKGDAAHNKLTFAVKYGIKASIWTAFIMVVIGFVLGVVLNDPIISHPILISLPLYIITVFKPNETWTLRTIRYSILFIALFLCCEFPYFFVVILINFYLARIYYISRFNLDYPTFRVEEKE